MRRRRRRILLDDGCVGMRLNQGRRSCLGMRLNQARAALEIGDNDRAVSSHCWQPAERQQHRTLRDKRW